MGSGRDGGGGGHRRWGTPRQVLRTLRPVFLLPSARRWGCSTKSAFLELRPAQKREPVGNLPAGAKNSRASTEVTPSFVGGWGVGRGGGRVGPICQAHSSGSDLSTPQSPQGFPAETNCLEA